MELRGARTLVTGATGGLGAAIARACTARGAEVIVTGRQEEPLDALARELGAEAIVADLANRDDTAGLVDAVRQLDVLVSNAALPGGGKVETFSIEEIDRVLEVNLRVPMVLSSHFTPAMVRRGCGHVVFVSSLAAAFPTPGLAIYNATKSALACYCAASWLLGASGSRSCTRARYEAPGCGQTRVFRHQWASAPDRPKTWVGALSWRSSEIAPK